MGLWRLLMRATVSNFLKLSRKDPFALSLSKGRAAQMLTKWKIINRQI